MKIRTAAVWFGVFLSLTLTLGFLPACEESRVEAKSYGESRYDYYWRYQSGQPAGTPMYEFEEEFCSSILKASGGRLWLDMMPAGAIVGVNELFDAVATGVREAGAVPDYYMQNKDPRFNLSGIIPASFIWEQAACYYYCDSTNGSQDTDALFEKFGVKRFVKGIAEPDVALMSNKRVAEIADFKGLKFRENRNIPITRILVDPEFGAISLSIPTADVYTSLRDNIIDAAEVGNAFSNWGSGYHEVTKYWSFPGMQQAQTTSFFVNMQKWKQLPEDLQKVVEIAYTHNLLRSWSFVHMKSAEIIPVLQQKHGIEMVRLSPECQQTWKTVSWRLADNIARENPDFKKMWESQKELINILAPYEELQRVTYTTEMR